LNDAPLIPTYANVYDYQDYAEMVGYSTAYPAELLRPYRWLSTEGNDALTTEDGDMYRGTASQTQIPRPTATGCTYTLTNSIGCRSTALVQQR
jgi:hypothetical protein